jgi:hypothetical protein
MHAATGSTPADSMKRPVFEREAGRFLVPGARIVAPASPSRFARIDFLWMHQSPDLSFESRALAVEPAGGSHLWSVESQLSFLPPVRTPPWLV